MKLKKKELEAGISTIRALRELANKDKLNIESATKIYKPKYRTAWGVALEHLGVIKKGSSFYFDKSYWNQKDYAYDYDLLMAVYEYLYKYQTKNNRRYQLKSKPADKYISFDHLSITEDEYWKLCDKYSKVKVDDIIDRIRNYKKNKKYKSLYLTACNWIERDYRNDIHGYWDKKENDALSDKYYSPAEAAELLGLPLRTIQYRCQKEDVLMYWGKYRISHNILEEWKKYTSNGLEEVNDASSPQPTSEQKTRHQIAEVAKQLKTTKRTIQRKLKKLDIPQDSEGYVITDEVVRQLPHSKRPVENEIAKTKWLKILGIKIYEKPVL